VFDLGASWLRETMGEGEVGTRSVGSNGEVGTGSVGSIGSEEFGLPSGAMEK